MSCDELRPFIERFIDGDVSEEVLQVLKTAATGNNSLCFGELANELAYRRMMKKVNPVETPSQVINRIREITTAAVL